MLVIVICLHTFNLIDHALPPMIVDREDESTRLETGLELFGLAFIHDSVLRWDGDAL